MTDDEVKSVTAKIKALADVRPIAIDDADSIIRSFHLELNSRNGLENGSAKAQPQEITEINGHELPETNGGAQAVVA